MSEKQEPITHPEEATGLSTTPETPTPSKSRNRPQRSRSTSKKQKTVSSTGEKRDLSTKPGETSTTAQHRSRAKRPTSTTNKDKRPASQRQRGSKQVRIEAPGGPATAEPLTEEISEPTAITEPKKKDTVTSKRTSRSRKKQKEQKLQASEAPPLTDAPLPGQETLAVLAGSEAEMALAEAEAEAMPAGTEAGGISVDESEQGVALIEPEGAINRAPTSVEDAIHSGPTASEDAIERVTSGEPELEVLPLEPELDPTSVKGKTVAVISPDELEPDVSPLEPELETPAVNGTVNGTFIEEVETIFIEVEPEVLEPDLDATLPRIKTITIPRVEAELEVSPEIPARPEPIERRRVLTSILLVILIGSSLLFWRDVTDTHLYLSVLDSGSGQTLAQQDLGGGYQGNAAITNPVQVTSSLVFGVHITQSTSVSQQRVFTLAGNDTSWHVESQFSAPLSRGTVGMTLNKQLIVEYAGGLQVLTSDDQLLWQLQGDMPALGAHPFQPAFDDSTLYTVKSAQNGLVAAYDLQSGAMRWTQKLDDTFKYAAPFLLNGNTLYIAGDHTIYALNSADGNLLWRVGLASRTLLALNQGRPLLVAAGAQGLIALNASTGAIAWSFSGQPQNTQGTANEMLMPAQFYQASIASTNDVIYATGIVWDAQQMREQLWLYAVDAATGSPRWSERIGSDFTSADAGRVYAPLVVITQGLVILEQARDDGAHTITAYSTGDGSQRWSLQLAGVTAAAPGLVQVSNNALILFNTQSNGVTALHNWSLIRVLLISMIGLSVLWLLLLWMPSFRLCVRRLDSLLHNLPRYLVYPLKLLLRLWRLSHKLVALALLVILVCGGVLAYVQLARPQNYLNQVVNPGGNIHWQRSIDTHVQLAMADAEGSIVITSAGASLHQLRSLDPDGVSQWSSFASEGAFSVPAVSTPPGTVLVALNGHIPLDYQFAPDDPAYAHPLDSLYTLYLLDRHTGQTVWQNTVVRAGEDQDTTVIGADAKFFYIASRATSSPVPGIDPVVQLIAVDKTTGIIQWHIYGPREPASAPTDFGSLLLQGRNLIWQVAGTVYDLDTVLGQIQWRQYIAENYPGAFPREEAQMAETAGVLLIERSDVYHALDPATGSQRWTVANPANDTVQTASGVVAADNIFLVYGGGILQAIDPTDQHIIWAQEHLEAVQSLKISDDHLTVYAILVNSLPVTQVLTAVDLHTGAIRWTFQPFEQEQFVNAQSDGFQYSKSTLYATVCLPANQPSCNREVLYAIDASTGETAWKYEASGIYDVRVSPHGDSVVFQTNSSTWGNLIQRFRS